MTFGVIVFSFGFLFFFFVWLFESFRSMKDLITHWGFRIVTDLAVENDFLEKRIEKMLERVLRKILSDILIRTLDERDKNKNR